MFSLCTHEQCGTTGKMQHEHRGRGPRGMSWVRYCPFCPHGRRDVNQVLNCARASDHELSSRSPAFSPPVPHSLFT